MMNDMNSTLEKLKMYGPGRFLKYALYEIYLALWIQVFKKSYSQAGEDIEIDKLLGNKDKGIYIDVGANDPRRFSNTKRFYDKGWWGINVEPDPDCFEKIKKARIRDINLNIGIAGRNSNLTFYKFLPHTLSTFSEEDAKKYENDGYRLLGKVKVPVRKLGEVLKENLKNKQVDFLSVDTEGLDLEVLKSNDWKNYPPKVICVESTEQSNWTRRKKDDLATFLEKSGYEKVFDNNINCIYKSPNL